MLILQLRAGELYFIGYQVDKAPYCWLGALDAEGQLMYDCPVPLPTGVMCDPVPAKCAGIRVSGAAAQPSSAVRFATAARELQAAQ